MTKNLETAPMFQADPFMNSVVEAVQRGLPIQNPAEASSLICRPPEFRHGQAAIPCFSLSKELRISPATLAQDLARKISVKRYDFIQRVEAIGGYVNFHCDFDAYGSFVLSSENRIHSPRLKEKIIVEFSQPNTHKALHVGHLRNMVYGDAICNLLEAVGHEVIRATYPGDMGTHIAKSLWYIRSKRGPLPLEENRADWLGKIYVESNEFLASFGDSPAADQARSEISGILQSLSRRKGDIYSLYLETREWSLEQVKEVYQWLGIHFDQWYFESECDEPSVRLVQDKLAEGVFIQNDGAVGMDLSKEGLGFALLLKSDGNGLYLTKDLELMRRKFQDQEVTRSIVVVDARQKHHFKQLFKICEKLGYAQASQSVHLSYETVTSEDGKAFSSRNLEGMKLSELKTQIEEKITREYLDSYRGQWSDEEIARTAQEIALGALKYGFVQADADNVIRFVLDDWLKLEGNTGPYLQYAHARCMSILERFGKRKLPSSLQLETDLERELVFELGRFQATVLSAAQSYRPSYLAGYLYRLAKLFNRFYKECPIKTAEPIIQETRLNIVSSVAESLKTGLGVLGIPAPTRM